LGQKAVHLGYQHYGLTDISQLMAGAEIHHEQFYSYCSLHAFEIINAVTVMVGAIVFYIQSTACWIRSTGDSTIAQNDKE
jgi:hypothetical protein